jgi:hypothetical protein
MDGKSGLPAANLQFGADGKTTQTVERVTRSRSYGALLWIRDTGYIRSARLLVVRGVGFAVQTEIMSGGKQETCLTVF